MNYRHAFHAGNFADVFKHAILVRALSYLRGKEAPFRVIDTHAGLGRYDLSQEASRTGEWHAGIERLMRNPPEGKTGELLAPYLSLIRAENPGGEIKYYPGSPAIIAALSARAGPHDVLRIASRRSCRAEVECRARTRA